MADSIRIGLFRLTGTPPTERGANVRVHVETEVAPGAFVSLWIEEVTELEWASLVTVSAAASELAKSESARTQIADSRLDLIFKIHQLAEEYAGPRPIDAQPEQDLEAIEEAIAGAQSERDEARNRVLRPLSPADIQAALHEGRAEAMAATGDNAWTSLLKQRDSLRSKLAEMAGLTAEACDIAHRAIEDSAAAMPTTDSQRIAAIRARAQEVAGE